MIRSWSLSAIKHPLEAHGSSEASACYLCYLIKYDSLKCSSFVRQRVHDMIEINAINLNRDQARQQRLLNSHEDPVF